jgi:hypothetical protein
MTQELAKSTCAAYRYQTFDAPPQSFRVVVDALEEIAVSQGLLLTRPKLSVIQFSGGG